MKRALIITCNDSYDYGTRTKYVEQVLVDQGYFVDHLLSDFDHRSKKRYEAEHPGTKYYIHVPSYSRNLSLQRIWSHIRFGQQVKRFVLSHGYDLVYHCAPPNYTIKELSSCKKRKSFKLITEVGDMWPESIPIRENLKHLLLIPFKVWSNLRDQNLANSDVVIAECDLFRDTIQKNSGLNKIQTLYFCKEFTGENRTIVYSSGNEIVLCYLGSINNIIDVDVIGKIIKELRKSVSVKLHIIGEGENRDHLIKTAERNGATVLYHGIIYDDGKKREIFDECHYALNIMKPEVFVGMTMKSLDYFSAGIPIINNIGGDVWKMVQQEKVGYNISSETFDDTVQMILNCDEECYRQLQRNVQTAHNDFFSIQHFKEKMGNNVR